MYHAIEFIEELQVDLETSVARRLERVRILPGTRVRAQIKPYVVEAEYGPVETADLFFEDGAARGVRFASFVFVE